MKDAAPTVHQAAAAGYSARADTYVTGRPDYPLAIEEWLRTALGLGDGCVAVDLGAGTGKFMPRLMATGARVIAVEPVAAMRTQLTRLFPQVEVREGTAERIPLQDGSIDAVVCAQSFHWFANGDALREMHRVLKPGGALGLIWNVRDESVDWVAALTRIVEPYEGDAPRYNDGEWRSVFPAEGFGSLHEMSFVNAHTGSPAQVIIDRMMSVSFIAALPEAERQQVLADLHALIASSPGLAGRSVVSMPYRTHAFWCLRSR